MTRYEAALQIVSGLFFHAPYCYASFLLFGAGHPVLAIYLLCISSLLTARALLRPLNKLDDKPGKGDAE